MTNRLKTYKEIEEYSREKRIAYFESLRSFCSNRELKEQTNRYGISFVAGIAPFTHKFKIEIRGAENLPQNDTAVFVCNHSNAHDTFVVREVFQKLNKPVTPLGALDGLGWLSRQIFRLNDVTFIRRDDSRSKENGILDFCSKILKGKSGFIFGEATWNMHPIKPMQEIKAGVTEVALITGKVIIPTVFEYIETPVKCKKERELYKKCIVIFGKPICVTAEDSLFSQSDRIKEQIEDMRRAIWSEIGIKRDSLEDIDKDVYMNHTYLKKFKTFGYKYNSEHEYQYLLQKNGICENGYYINEQGDFVPGIIEP